MAACPLTALGIDYRRSQSCAVASERENIVHLPSQPFAKSDVVSYNKTEFVNTPMETVGLHDTLVIYTHPDCGYSSAAKDEFLQSDIPFKEIDLSITPEAWQEVERLTGGGAHNPGNR